MDGPEESFSKFKNFLNILFIRRKKEGFNVNDFKKDEFEYIQHHLEELLPLMSIEEAQRIKIYFHNAYIFHLNNGLGIANIFPQRSLTPDRVSFLDDEVEKSFHQERLEDGEQSSQQEGHETELRTVDDCELYSQQFEPEQTPLESDNRIQTQNSGPLMQSTPLSVPSLPNAQEQEKGDLFFDDIISQINISPIPVESAHLRTPHVQPTTLPTHNQQLNEVPFLRNFANIEGGEHLHEQSSVQNIRRKTRKRPNVNLFLREPKKRMDRVKFDVLCCFPHKNRTDKQIKRSEQSFLYFSLNRAKQTYISSTSTAAIPEGERGHTSLQRVSNFSNVLRAHASQSQNSVEQPVQISHMNSTRSPLTPQDLLQTSLPFTPLRGDISGFEPRMVIDQASSFPTRSLLRQQPLLPIPERESSIHIPLNPQVEEMSINDPATSSNFPREDPGNIEMLERQSLQVADKDPSQNETQLNKSPLNSSVISVQPLLENEPIFPLGIAENQLSNVPGEIIEQPQPQVDSLTLAQQSLAIDRQMETQEGIFTGTGAPTDAPTSVPEFFPDQPLLTEAVPTQLQQTIAEDPDVPLLDGHSDNRHFSWFEVLRPRVDQIEYPQEVPSRRKRKRRMRRDSTDRVVRPRRLYDLPAIPRSQSHENINELAPVGVSDKIVENQELNNLEEFNTSAQVEVSNQIIQNLQNLFIDLPGDPLSPPARYSEETDGISHQVTQYPTQIEKQLKDYFELIKRAGRKLEYVNWERFDSFLFNENDRFELYTNIFKQIIKDNYVAMDRLYKQGTTRLEAAKGFRFILDLKTMGLIEIESIETRILGIRLISAINTKKF